MDCCINLSKVYMKKLIFVMPILIIFGFCSKVSAQDFEDYLSNLKLTPKGISNTINNVMNNVKYLPDVIKYDRYQPEFGQKLMLIKIFKRKSNNWKKYIKIILI